LQDDSDQGGNTSVNGNANTKDTINSSSNNNDSLGTSNSAEEGPSTDETPADNSADTDDITVVVPLDFTRGETNTENNGVFPANKDDESDKGPSSSSIAVVWTSGMALVLFVVMAGYALYRHRERSRWREYRTHRILQEHVEAFDLSFHEEDEYGDEYNDDNDGEYDVELSNFS
jgi:hypothetical protein